MQARRIALAALVWSALATTAAHAIAPVTVFGFKAPDSVAGFELNEDRLASIIEFYRL